MTYLQHKNVSNNFEQNLRDIIYKDLHLSQNQINDFNVIDFIQVLDIHKEYKSRLILPKKYQVNISKELQTKINQNNFEEKDTIPKLNNLINKLQNAEDIIPHLSRSVKDKQYNDALYNDWEIYHLHLGINIESDGYVERTKNVLFVMKDNNNIYLIDILSHGNGNLPWTKKSLLEIVDNNWSFLLDSSDLGSGVSPVTTYDESEHYKLRKNDINVITSINGRTLMPINLGVTLAGTSVMAHIISMSLIRHLEFFHNFVVNNYQQIAEFLKMENIILEVKLYNPDDFNIKFSIANSDILIYIQATEKRMITRISFIKKDLQEELHFTFE